MTQRVRRYPPLNARLILLDEGPPMYRMLGYADKNNVHSDLCDPVPVVGYSGPFATVGLPVNKCIPFGPSRFGLPQGSLAYTTSYWDDCAYPRHFYVDGRPLNKMCRTMLPEERPAARCFPEMAVPGTGVNSRCKDSGFLNTAGLPKPKLGF